ncbi:hypothetical protein AT05_06790 [Schleiferia thermophila str. Yellowstone]|uniref:TolC family protein n=1 Tax=Schleiferia thermophila TaxID=884107 RepID=UPI0004E63D04|nr:TolC family protein [Schleiferia thermophila]KFD39080.1 hypothetical protein AT05_06790 [Schleiferia thermophila str. Yellowstone]
MKTFKPGTILLAFFLTLSLNAQKEELRQLMEKVLTNHPGIQIARNNLKIADLLNNPGQAGMLPVVDIVAGANQSIQNTDLEFFSGQKSSAENARSQGINSNARLEWLVFDGLRMFALKNNLKLQELLADASLRAAVENSLFELITTYYSYLIQRNILLHSAQNLQLSKNRLHLTRAKFQSGKVSRLDLLLAEQDFNQDSATYLREKLTLQQFQNHIARLTGEPFMPNEIDPATFPLLELPPKVTWLEQLYTQNTELTMARLRLSQSKQAEKAQLADFLPQIGVFGEYSINRQQNEIGVLKSLISNGSNTGIFFRWNLFNGMADRNRRKAMQLETENAALEIKNLEFQLREIFENAYHQLSVNLAVYNLETENQESVALQAQIAEQQYIEGKISDLEYRNAQTSLLNAKLRLERSYLQSLISYLELMLYTGQITENLPI